ncbi:DUF3991 and toprim domain-containing protein [Rhizobium sp. CB3060]|uniref:DUF3991 and toprim domain-containing protein n=1 Tax=Rhizobium sp. CB3060 TaxID=3138255 RepID=UPI0028897D6E|nr:DUF3991 and toprim domain-containing protein [Rhizobium tropici]
MRRKEVEDLRQRVPCAAVLDKAGFAVDLRESTRRAVKFRRDGDIIIVIHDGKGWFDPLGDAEAKGDVFSLMKYLDGVSFPEGLRRVAELVGYRFAEPAWQPTPKQRAQIIPIGERWGRRRKPWRGSPTWKYLADDRLVPDDILRVVIRQELLREGPYGSVWAAHVDDAGLVTGWEERGPHWRGFASGGAKVLFRMGSSDAIRACVTEAAIDAMSLAAIEDARIDSVYLSTGGGWAPATETAIRTLANRPGMQLVAATDNNLQGEVYAGRIEAIAGRSGCAFERLRPMTGDWNEDLGTRGRAEKKEEGNWAAACPPVRVKGEAPPGCAGP